MRDSMAEGNLSPPCFQSDRINNSFLVILLFHHFLSPQDVEWLNDFRGTVRASARRRHWFRHVRSGRWTTRLIGTSIEALIRCA